MYLDYWQLKAFPFENVPNPAFFFASTVHDEALSRLVFTVRQGKGSALVVGDVGCGKTMLTRALPEHLPSDKYRIAQMSNPALEPDDFIEMVLMLLNIPYESPPRKAKMLWALEGYLRQELAEGVEHVLIIDEAQTIRSADTLEELRLLLNLQTSTAFLLTVILMGQKELETHIAQCPPLHQRLAFRFRLGPLPGADTVNYIRHRLKVAGARRMLFTNEALKAIFQRTRGIPRQINNLCDRALLAACMARKPHVDSAAIEESWSDLQ